MLSDPGHPAKPAEPSPDLGPELPVVRRLMEAALASGLAIPPDTRLIAVQHMVRTNLTLFQMLFALGVQPCNTYAIGKGYSTASSVEQALRAAGVRVFKDLSLPRPGQYEKAREEELQAFWRWLDGRKLPHESSKVIIADVGGRMLSLAEAECRVFGREAGVVGVEQTTSGIRRLDARARAFPIIDVAQAAAKSLHESPLVAETILDRVDRRPPRNWPKVRAGVIGLGEVGRAMVAKLRSRNIEVMASHADERIDAAQAGSLTPFATLVERAEIIFGCTGQDVFAQGLPTRHQPNLVLVSCSSEDIEFRSLLARANGFHQTNWPAADLTIAGPSGPVTILCGGYPLNFDTSGISVDEQKIQTTTALMLAGILTAAWMLSNDAGDRRPFLFQLPPSLQAAILKQGRESGTDGAMLPDELMTPEYLAAHSPGRVLENQKIFVRTSALMQT